MRPPLELVVGDPLQYAPSGRAFLLDLHDHRIHHLHDASPRESSPYKTWALAPAQDVTVALLGSPCNRLQLISGLSYRAHSPAAAHAAHERRSQARLPHPQHERFSGW